MPTVAELVDALKIAAPDVAADNWAPSLMGSFQKYALGSNRRIAAAMGQYLVEAGSALAEIEENLNYGHAARVHEVFRAEFPTIDSAIPYVNNPVALGNKVYANRNGNGDEASGDGYLFRGRGLIQLTGRTEYTEFAASIDQSVDAATRYCTTKAGAAMCGGWYLSTRGCLPLADAWELDAITRKVNGAAMEEAAERRQYANAMLNALNGA